MPTTVEDHVRFLMREHRDDFVKAGSEDDQDDAKLVDKLAEMDVEIFDMLKLTAALYKTRGQLADRLVGQFATIGLNMLLRDLCAQIAAEETVA